MTLADVELGPIEVLWTHGSEREPEQVLEHPVRAQVVVIGAGIAGLTAAVAMAAAGVEVVVIEARRVGEGTTGLSSAKVTALHGITYQAITSVHGDEVAARYAAANLEGLRWLEGFAGDAAGEPYWQTDVALTFAASEDERGTIEAEARAAAQAGLPVELVDDARTPFANHGAVVLSDQGRIDPRRHLDALVATFLGHGGRLFQRTRVTGVERASGGHRISTDHGEALAEEVLVTTGLPVLDRSLAFARTTCERSYVVAVRAEHHPEGMLLSAAEQPISLRRAPHPSTGESLVLVGGEGHPTGREADTLACYRRLYRWAEEHLGATDLVAHWSTQDRKSVDHVPYVGAVRPDHSVRIATAFGKWGMTNGTVAGLVLAAQAQGEASPWSDLFDASRLGPPRSLPSAARANAEVAGELTSGWVGGALRTSAPVDDGEGWTWRDGVHPVATSVVDGRRRCLGAVCPHLGGLVTWNPAERSWDCPLHGSRFDHEGEVLDGPAVRPLRTVSSEREQASEMQVTEITIDAPPARVFDVVVEPRTYPHWLRGAREIRSVDPEWPEPGSSFHHQVGVAPLVLNDATTVRELEPGRLLELRAKARPAGVARVRFELEELAGGSTRVVLREAPESGPGHLIWSLGGRLGMRPMLRMRNESSLQQLKQLVEAAVPAP
jgi:glycine/D-amino acid oxidase-like deaminating enzyme/uncharacterized protein YndB with AHSA1/START domain